MEEHETTQPKAQRILDGAPKPVQMLFRTFEATNDQRPKMTAVGFEPTFLRNGALSHRLRPLGQTVLPDAGVSKSKRNCSGLLCVPAHSVHDIDAILDHNITSEG